MRLSRLLHGVTTLHTPPDCEIASIADDSRAVCEGALFIAVQGPIADGHDYIPAARANGCAVVVTERALDAPHVLVADTRIALPQIAANFYGHPADKLTLLGITGTNGKTSVSQMVAGLLTSLSGVPCGRIGTHGCHIGDTFEPLVNTTPGAITLQRLLALMVSKGCTHCVMEVSSHALAQHRVDGLHYKAAAFTNLTPDHLNDHGTMEDYYLAKRKLFNACDTSVINIDDPYGARLYGELSGSKRSLAIDTPADYNAHALHLTERGVSFTIEDVPVTWHTPGRFSVYNALTTLALLDCCGYDVTQTAQAMQALPPVAGRMERVPLDGAPFTCVIDYGHTPDGLRNALQAARGFTQNKLIALFGCGGDRDKTKRPLMGKAAVECADAVYITSDNPRNEAPEAIIADILSGIENTATITVIPDRATAMQAAMQQAQAGDVLICLGMSGDEFFESQGQRTPYNERNAVRNSWERVHHE